jgi:uncharacterized membrane protein YdjX (TVP38/TMEM64 family)
MPDLATFLAADPGIGGMALFALGGGLAVVFFFPGSVIMTAAGAAFGLVRGFLIAHACATLGAALAFLVSRYLARHRVARWVSSKPAFAAVDEAVAGEGFKIVLLSRFCPLFPYIFQNYAFGLTRVRFSHYTLASFVGLLPSTLAFSYLGSLGRAGAKTVSGDASTLGILLHVFGLLATIGLAIYIARLSRRALAKAGV